MSDGRLDDGRSPTSVHATSFRLSRRQALLVGAGALGAAATGAARALISPAHAEEVERHGISAFGDLKYPADFKHF